MAARGHLTPALERRAIQTSGMMRHGTIPGGHQLMDSLPRHDSLENKIAAQAAEIERLVGDNRRLAATHVTLREDLLVTQQEVQRVKAHIRSIQTESDIQIRLLLDKISKIEAGIRTGENVKKELQQAHIEAQGLVKARQELTTQIQQVSQELQRVQADVKDLPELHSKLDKLNVEYKRLRSTFEYEKGVNIEKVKQLQAMEQTLIGMAREVEKLRGAVLNAEKGTHARNAYPGGYVGPHPSYPLAHGGSAYADAYVGPLVQMGIGPASNGMIPYGDGSGEVAGSAVLNVSGGTMRGGPFDPSLAQR